MGAYDMIVHLRQLYQEQAPHERFNVSKALFQAKLTEGSPVGPHVLNMIGYVETLRRLGFSLESISLESHRCFLRALATSTADLEDSSTKLVWIPIEASRVGRLVDDLKDSSLALRVVVCLIYRRLASQLGDCSFVLLEADLAARAALVRRDSASCDAGLELSGRRAYVTHWTWDQSLL
ncbi:hypothetical protein CRG98_011360 [Punica granatum]|uniref:Uncharacterized protein n=1 Tax=Punica granatum TaxID=22663 RepID=A0A2I0KI75_PUNGR|nr:hypothetical protein CRG98_011360 [Punica granatum]